MRAGRSPGVDGGAASGAPGARTGRRAAAAILAAACMMPIEKSSPMAASPTLEGDARPAEVLAWAMYDFANSGYTTVVVTAVFNAYFVAVIAGNAPWATFAWTAALSASYALILLTAPVLGAYADLRAAKKRSEEHTSELQSLRHLVCRLLLEKKKRRSSTTSPNHYFPIPPKRWRPDTT